MASPLKLLGMFLFFSCRKNYEFPCSEIVELSGWVIHGVKIPSIGIRIVMFFNAILGFSRDPCKMPPILGGGSKNAKMYGKW